MGFCPTLLRNGVIKVNPDKSQRSFLFKCQIVWSYNANLSINLVVKQDTFSNIFFLSVAVFVGVLYTATRSGTISTFIVYVSSYVPDKTVWMCRLV